MTRWLLALLILVAAPAAAAERPTGATITRSGERWTAELTFTRDSPVWLFTRSNVRRDDKQSWRTRSIKVLTPGVELRRVGNYDALVAKRGTVPRRVRLAFTPADDDLMADYDPALVFTDGSVALFTGHWDLFPARSLAAAERLPADLSGMTIAGDEPTALTFRYPGGRILHGGARRPVVRLTNNETYVLFGAARTVEASAITTIIDPQLPTWLADEIATFTPRLLTHYAERLGPRAAPKPMVMVSWAGPTPKLRSLGGSVLPGLVLIRLEGEALVKPDPATLASARWFLAHESAHFWLGQEVRYGGPGEAWITEGGADLLAVRAVGALDPAFDQKRELQRRLDQCVELAPKGAIASAYERNQHDVYYGCGAMFALAAEAAAAKSGGSFMTFVKGAIAANKGDGVLNRGDWLAAFARAGGSADAAAIIAAMLDGPTADPRARLAALFDRSGVAYRRGADGALLLS
jgi:hypothetical protein